MGFTTAIFSGVNALLLRPVAGVGEPARAVEVGRTSLDGKGFGIQPERGRLFGQEEDERSGPAVAVAALRSEQGSTGCSRS